jgi:ubiquinone/menaquinone biosynthesis C-methylase UbiE
VYRISKSKVSKLHTSCAEITNLDCAAIKCKINKCIYTFLYIEKLEEVVNEAYRILKPGKYIAWLIGDQAKKKKFVPAGFKMYSILEKYFKPVDIICVTRHNQTSNTSTWHERARKYNFYLRGFKYLIIMQRANK